MPPQPAPLPLRGQLLVRLVAGICGAGGLGLLTWALARQIMDPAMRLASVGAGLGLVASAVRRRERVRWRIISLTVS